MTVAITFQEISTAARVLLNINPLKKLKIKIALTLYIQKNQSLLLKLQTEQTLLKTLLLRITIKTMLKSIKLTQKVISLRQPTTY